MSNDSKSAPPEVIALFKEAVQARIHDDAPAPPPLPDKQPHHGWGTGLVHE